MQEINIYGDIVPFVYWAENEYCLKNLKEDLDNLEVKEGDTLTINIHTFGGDTTTAFAMYNLLKRFKVENKVTIKTRVDGYCASAGVILLLAGDQRIGSKYLKPFVHNAWTYMFDANKDDAKRIYEDLEKVDNEIAELYAEETSISKEEALQFMNESRDLTIEECQKFGFYTEIENVKLIENKAFNSIIQRNQKNRHKYQNNMDKNKKSAWNSIKNQIENFLNGNGKVNKVVFTATNEELDFYELENEDVIEVGAKAKFDGKPAGDSNDGTYIVQSGETYKFEGEKLVEIIPKEEEENPLEEENKQLKGENENLKAENSEKDKQIEALNKQLKEAKGIINKLNSFVEEEEDSEDPKPRDPKPSAEPKRNLFKNLI